AQTSPMPIPVYPRRPLSPSSLRDVELPVRLTARANFPRPPTGHELMSLFPPAPPLYHPGPTSGYFRREERQFFAQAGKEIVRVHTNLEKPGSADLHILPTSGPCSQLHLPLSVAAPDRGPYPSTHKTSPSHEHPHAELRRDHYPCTPYDLRSSCPPPQPSLSSPTTLSLPVRPKGSSQILNPTRPGERVHPIHPIHLIHYLLHVPDVPLGPGKEPGQNVEDAASEAMIVENGNDAERHPGTKATRRRAGKHTRRTVV
ncbi:hypothetical protein GY45DRAFT_1207682, partial [Cubamyces sp. BRFM 1775]